MRMKRTYLLLLVLGLYLSLQAVEIAWSQVTERVSVDSAGVEGNNASTAPSTSTDGRYVAFESQADNLVAGDILGNIDIFVRDRQTETTTRVSVDSTGSEGDGDSNLPSISSDGRHVAFESNATNLVANDINTWSDIFVRDRDADRDGIYDEPGTVSTIRMSEDSDGNEANAASNSPSISADGRHVAFESSATNLVPGGSNGLFHIFIHDRDTDRDGIYDEPGQVSTVQISVDSTGAEGIGGDSSACSISGDGRYVAFESDASNLVADDNNVSTDVFVHDRQTGVTTRASVDLDGVERNDNSNFPSMSADGSSVTFQSDADLVADDNNGVPDIFADDLQAGAGEDEGGGNGNNSSGCFIATAGY